MNNYKKAKFLETFSTWIKKNNKISYPLLKDYQIKAQVLLESSFQDNFNNDLWRYFDWEKASFFYEKCFKTKKNIGTLKKESIQNKTLTYQTESFLITGIDEKVTIISDKNIKGNQDLIKKYLKFTNIKDPFYLSNASTFTDFILIMIPENFSSKTDISLEFNQKSKDESFKSIKLILVLKSNAKANILVENMGKAERSLFIQNIAWDIYLEPDSELNFTSIKSKAVPSICFDSYQIQQLRNSKLNLNFFGFNSDFIRNFIQLEFQGDNSQAKVNGLNIPGKNSTILDHSLVHHNAMESQSDQLFKNLNQDKSTTEFNGLVFIDANASNSKAMQYNHNLLLSDTSRAHSRPQLRILNQDVQANHGSTVGQIDQTVIFYLNQRGISKSRAKKLLLQAFATTQLDNLSSQAIKNKVATLISQNL